MQSKPLQRRFLSWILLFMSALSMIISLAGPAWTRLPVPTYQHVQPRVVVLDMSNAMSLNDLTPNRLARAKFKLHDLFLHHDAGQFGMVVYTAEPFVVSPLTEDGETIDALLPSLTQEMMPRDLRADDHQLSSALELAGKLIVQAGFQSGDILVLSASKPSNEDISTAHTLLARGIHTSVLPVLSSSFSKDPSFKKLANAGGGQLIPFSDTSVDIETWLSPTKNGHKYLSKSQDDIPMWRDEGRWFLLPALLFLLPAFRRDWLQRIYI
jgi:Ca-activated chloride channel family protein